jgi:hypothetical protein
VTTAEVFDEMANNLIAAGGVLAAIPARLDPQPVMATDGVTLTNAITVQLPFMKSRYRLTVERIPDDES